MLDILNRIISHKHKEIAAAKSNTDVKSLEASPLFERSAISLKKKLSTTGFGIVAEFKRRSPSKGIINDKLAPETVSKGYEQAGAAAISVLTDERFFGGTIQDLKKVRTRVNIPILRKDFMVDEYQIFEAKAVGADIILLIAAVLNPKQLKDLSFAAKQLGLEILLEVHSCEELDRSLNEYVDLVGVNNRNLKTFEVSTSISKNLADLIPDNFIKVSESGIHDIATIKDLKQHGFQGFLIGENFMKAANPMEACQNFLGAFKDNE